MRPSYTLPIYKSSKAINYLERCKETNSEHIKRLFRNNRYLLKKHGFTLQYQIDWLKHEGVIVSRSAISRYERGKYQSCALTYLQIFALFWSIPLFKLISSDLECEEQIINF